MKAILVIDMPESCTSCLLGICNKKWFCLKTNKDIDLTDRYNIPSWCPLKPIPEKKKTDVITYDDYGAGWDCGYNACIDELLGEEE